MSFLRLALPAAAALALCAGAAQARDQLQITGSSTVLVDFGMFQGDKDDDARNVIPGRIHRMDIDAVVLTQESQWFAQAFEIVEASKAIEGGHADRAKGLPMGSAHNARP